MGQEDGGGLTQLTGSSLNWSLLLRLARPHGLMPLLYWHLRTICPDSVPPSTLEELRDHFERNSRRNLLSLAELLELLKLFDQNGIAAIPYKGPVLAATVYGNLALREFIDLDILVPKSRVREARDLLVARGYQPGSILATDRQEAAFLDSGHELVHRHPTKQSGVELQWALLPRYMTIPIALEQLRRSLVPITIGKATVPGFPPEDLLLILCVHGANHCWQRLDWICGVSEVIRRHREIDWPRMVEQADALGCRRILFLGLFLAASLLKSAVPKGLRENIESDDIVRSLADEVERRLFDLSAVPRNPLATALFHLRTRERLRDQVTFSFRLATTLTPADMQWADLPGKLHLFYFPVRLVRLVLKYGGARRAL